MKYTGQVRDPETQLDYMNARYYDPAQGRFQAMDPSNAGADEGSPQTFNGFAYVNNSPLNNTDPSGRYLATSVGSGGGPIGTIIGALIDLGFFLSGDLFGGGGGGTPPKPDWSTTVWGTSQTQTTQVSGAGSAAGIAAEVGIAVFPGILASVTGTAKSSSDAVRPNPCASIGRALPPSVYATAGKASKWNPVNALLDLSMGFKIGGYLDAQPLAQGNPFERAAYGNYAYGVWMEASGTPLSVALAGANGIALLNKYKPGGYRNQYSGRQMGSPFFTSIPAANIANITAGYNAQKNGTTCH